MKITKLIAGMLACAMMGISMPCASYVDLPEVMASEEAEYTEGTYGALTYKNFGDHIEISDCDISATEVEIPSEIDGIPVTVIGKAAFQQCTELTLITIPQSIESIGYYAFNYCVRLTSISIPDSVTEVNTGAFKGCYSLINVRLPEKLDSLQTYLFTDCTSLTTIDIPQSVKSIEAHVFSGCTSLKSIELPEGLELIDGGAFRYCSELTEITIPETVTSIGAVAFADCTGLTSITLPDSVKTIKGWAFRDCISLEEINISSYTERIGGEAFVGTAWYNNQPDGLIYLNKIAYDYKGEMPENTELILKEDTYAVAGEAFLNCTGLISITLPDSVVYIGGYAFNGCSNLQELKLPAAMKTVGEAALYGASGLKSIVIHDNIEFVDRDAFYDCTSLESVTFENKDCGIYDYRTVITENAVIYGYTNSTAQAYAEKYGYTFVALDEISAESGDANSNGSVEVADAVFILQGIADPGNQDFALSESGIITANCKNPNSSGVDSEDALAIQMFKAELIPSLPAE